MRIYTYKNKYCYNRKERTAVKILSRSNILLLNRIIAITKGIDFQEENYSKLSDCIKEYNAVRFAIKALKKKRCVHKWKV